MDIDTRNRELTFTIHGLDSVDGAPDKFVPADVFVQQVQAFLNALKSADKAINQRPTREFVVSNLDMGSAVVAFKERPKARANRNSLSSVTALIDCSNMIYRGEQNKARERYNGVTTKLEAITKGVGKRFSFIEMMADHVAEIRVDDFFSRQIAVLGAKPFEEPNPNAFKGQARDAFDGTLKELDLRGQIARGKFILHAANKEIDCVFRRLPVEKVKEALDQRCWVEGTAIYQGTSFLPQRLEVDTIRHKRKGKGIERWHGAVPPFDLGNWGVDFDDVH
jgi:hypothetical protein